MASRDQCPLKNSPGWNRVIRIENIPKPAAWTWFGVTTAKPTRPELPGAKGPLGGYTACYATGSAGRPISPGVKFAESGDKATARYSDSASRSVFVGRTCGRGAHRPPAKHVSVFVLSRVASSRTSAETAAVRPRKYLNNRPTPAH